MVGGSCETVRMVKHERKHPCMYDMRWSPMQERLLIFSNNPGSKAADGGRAHAERMVNEMVQELGNTETWET